MKKHALDKIQKENKACKRCPIKDYYPDYPAVPGCGNHNADIMLVGEAPGEDEMKQGIPFVGRAGKVLDNAIRDAGLSREELYIHNILSCRPLNNKFPSYKLTQKCIKWIKMEIFLIRPKIIVAVGRVPYECLTNRTNTKITKERGALVSWSLDNVFDTILIPTLHPSYCMRRLNMLDEHPYNMLVQDLALAKKMS